MSSYRLLIDEFKAGMMNTFEMSDMGLMHYFLGLEVKQGHEEIFVSQKKYVENLLNKYNMQQCKKTLTPMNTNEKMQMQDGSGYTDPKLYRSLIRGLNYLVHTRPDISFSVSMVSKYMSNPSKVHYAIAKRVLCYIAGTINFGLWYGRTSNFKLIGFTDIDWAGSLDNRRSTFGSVLLLGSCAITWGFQKQEITALSTSAAQYVVATSLACQAVWLRRLLEDMGQVQVEATEIFSDNRSAISITKIPTMH